MTYKHAWMGWALTAALVCGGLVACDDSNENASPTEIGSAGRKSSGSTAGKGGSSSSSSAGKGGSQSSTTSGQSSESGKGGSGGKGGSSSEARGGSGGSGGSSASAAPQDCKDQGPKDCICEAPRTDEQFLNHCSAATCNPFDNKKLSKLKSDGSLPALP